MAEHEHDGWVQPRTFRTIEPEPIEDLIAIVETMPEFDIGHPENWAALECAKAALANRHVVTGEPVLPPGLQDAAPELLSSLERMTEILTEFVTYYEIPRNHPDAELILTECRKAFAIVERFRATTTEAEPTC